MNLNAVLCTEIQFLDYTSFRKTKDTYPHIIDSPWEIYHPKPERQDAVPHSKILNDLKIGHQRFDYQFSFMQFCLLHCLIKKIKHN